MAQQSRRKEQTLKVSVSALGIDSTWEPHTLAACRYREKHVYPHFARKGYAVEKCQGPMALRSSAAPIARQPGVVYITGVGHGTSTTYDGLYCSPVFQVGNYSAAESGDKIVHFLACESAQDLGPDFVRNGCRAFFGYDEQFIATTEDEDLFFECDSEIDRAFADGLTAAEVYDRVQALFKKRAADLRAKGKQTAAGTLESDLDRLRCPSSPPAPRAGPNAWGDPRAKLP
jgi:hypothetical protein